LFDASYRVPEPGATMRYIVNEFEPVFDASTSRAAVATCSSPAAM
jgi:hypothetical protein